MTSIETCECTCDKCVGMCKYRPCWGTPAEIKKLIDMGLSERLMLDWWCAESPDSENILIIVPAIIGSEGLMCTWWPAGTCTFLKDNRCEIHDNKPVEGCIASHDNKEDVHRDIAMLWDSGEGEEVVNLWRTKTKCYECPSF